MRSKVMEFLYGKLHSIHHDVQLEITGFGRSNLDALAHRALDDSLLHAYTFWESDICRIDDLYRALKAVVESDSLFPQIVVRKIFDSQFTFVSYLFELKLRSR